jgi:hypothetical protein
VTAPVSAVPARDPFAALDAEIAEAIAAKLAGALRRYAAPALFPLIVEKLADDLDTDRE